MTKLNDLAGLPSFRPVRCHSAICGDDKVAAMPQNADIGHVAHLIGRDILSSSEMSEMQKVARRWVVGSSGEITVFGHSYEWDGVKWRRFTPHPITIDIDNTPLLSAI